MTETRQRTEGREEEGQCPLQRGQKTLTAVTLTLRRRNGERAPQPVSDAMTDGHYNKRSTHMYI